MGAPRQMSMSIFSPKDVERPLSGPRVVGKRRVAMMLSAALGMSPDFMDSELDMAAAVVTPKPSLSIEDLTFQLSAYKPKREFPAPDRIPVPKKFSRNKHKR